MLSLLQAYSTYSSYSSYPRSTYSSSTYSSSSSAAETGLIAAALGSIGLILFVGFVLVVLLIIARWKIFSKAGEAGWKSIIPIYADIVLLQIVGLNPAFVLLAIFVAPVYAIIMAIYLAKAFGKGGGTIAGLILLPTIFYLILGFGKAQYDPSVRVQPAQPQGPQQPPQQPMQ